MVEKEVFQGSVKYTQILDENGNVDSALFPISLTDSAIVEMYKYMLFARAFDNKCLSLQRQGRLATYSPQIGEEATNIGTVFAMRKQDIFVPAFRQHGVFIKRGMPLWLYFVYWRGFEDGSKIPKEVNGLPVSIPVGTQVPHGAGVAFALKYLNKNAAAVAFVGDGGTSEGDFYEALNFAGVWHAPLIVIIENNQWAISVPRSKQTMAETLAQKGIAAGIRCVQVDGNDVVAVYKAVVEAIDNSPEGPTLIECVTYRMSMHTTADDPTKYRTEEEVNEWAKKDPILRVKMYLTNKGLWNDDVEKQTMDQQQKQIDDAVEEAEKFAPDPDTMFEHVYSFMPPVLKDELEEAKSADFWRGGE